MHSLSSRPPAPALLLAPESHQFILLHCCFSLPSAPTTAPILSAPALLCSCAKAKSRCGLTTHRACIRSTHISLRLTPHNGLSSSTPAQARLFLHGMPKFPPSLLASILCFPPCTTLPASLSSTLLATLSHSPSFPPFHALPCYCKHRLSSSREYNSRVLRCYHRRAAKDSASKFHLHNFHTAGVEGLVDLGPSAGH